MAKWFPDKRGLAVGLAVGGYGGRFRDLWSAGGQLFDCRRTGWRTTFQILGAMFLVMTVFLGRSC